MISVFSWNATTKRCAWGTINDLPPKDAMPDVLWIDLEAPTVEEEKLIYEEFYPIHPLSLEDVTRLRREPGSPPHFPKIEEFPNYLFVIVNPLTPLAAETLLDIGPGDSSDRPITQLSAILTHRLLITHHYEPLVAINALHSQLQKHDAQASRGPDFLFHLILDQMVDEFAPLLDQVDASLDELEVQVFTKPSRKLLGRLLQLKRSIISLRKTIIYEREILARMSRGEFSLIDEREMVYYRNVYDHLIRFTELLEASREMVMDLMQTQLASQANKLNEIMKVLTMISTTILPMSLVAGIYGMNFEKEHFWPRLDTPWGFTFSIFLMFFSGAFALGLFRWMRWL